jgi:putative hydrolase of the HAD superfamily
VIRAVFFDYGHVLTERGFSEVLRGIARDRGLDETAVLTAGLDALYDSGYLTGRGTEEAFWRLLGERAGVEGDPAELTDRVIEAVRLRPGMIDLVRELRRRGLRVFILSDHTDWLERLDARDGFYREFERVFNSWRMGKGKRDGSLFDDVLAAVGVVAEEAVFVDDDPGNVARARSRGLHAILFTDLPSFRPDLEALLAGG